MRVEPATCPVCGVQYDPLRARAVTVTGGRVRAFCSTACKERSLVPEPAPAIEAASVPARPRPKSRVAALGGTLLLVATVAVGWRIVEHSLPRAAASLPLLPPASIVKPLPKLPTQAEAMKIIAPKEEENDAWVHPLYGPVRRLPLRNTRRFGAAREGMRPEECEGGHCGVDLGSARGEPVICAHDGVVERVVRDPNEGGRRGNEGRFLRINHKGGTVVTSYMHLDSIREDLKPGVPVKAGEVIGAIGDTGVLRSGPHLHFAVSVRPNPDETETFINPEPLLLLWPLKNAPPPNLLPSKHRTAQAAPTVAQGG